jgi:transcriptional regulator GlxA family with amidase domain
MKTIDIAVVALESTLLSTAMGVEDIVKIYNQFCKGDDEAAFNVIRIGEGGFSIDDGTFDVIIIPPLLVPSDFTFELPALNVWLIHHYHMGTILTSACVGSFFLAKTGLLDGKRATTHWQYEEKFKSIFTSIILESDKILVDEGKIITAGGVSAYMDLVLHIIEKFHSKTNALRCANILLVDTGRSSQRCYKELPPTVFIDDREIKESKIFY